tara:strand:+ start:686 stop:883 length:198 start_codon:yes stop_codon:yes gene_type:complete
MKNLKELKKLNDSELRKKVKDYRKEAFNLRFQKSSGQLENVSRISKVRKEIARIKTIINNKRSEN